MCLTIDILSLHMIKHSCKPGFSDCVSQMRTVTLLDKRERVLYTHVQTCIILYTYTSTAYLHDLVIVRILIQNAPQCLQQGLQNHPPIEVSVALVLSSHAVFTEKLEIPQSCSSRSRCLYTSYIQSVIYVVIDVGIDYIHIYHHNKVKLLYLHNVISIRNDRVSFMISTRDMNAIDNTTCTITTMTLGAVGEDRSTHRCGAGEGAAPSSFFLKII